MAMPAPLHGTTPYALFLLLSLPSLCPHTVVSPFFPMGPPSSPSCYPLPPLQSMAEACPRLQIIITRSRWAPANHRHQTRHRTDGSMGAASEAQLSQLSSVAGGLGAAPSLTSEGGGGLTAFNGGTGGLCVVNVSVGTWRVLTHAGRGVFLAEHVHNLPPPGTLLSIYCIVHGAP